MGEGRAIPAQNGRHHHGGFHRHLGIGLLSPSRRFGRPGPAAGEFLHRPDRQGHRTRHGASGLRLEAEHRHPVGCRCQGAGSQLARCALCRRCRGRPDYAGRAPAHHAARGLWLYGLRTAILPVYRYPGCHQAGGGQLEMGGLCRHVYHRVGLDHVLCRPSAGRAVRMTGWQNWVVALLLAYCVWRIAKSIRSFFRRSKSGEHPCSGCCGCSGGCPSAGVKKEMKKKCCG